MQQDDFNQHVDPAAAVLAGGDDSMGMGPMGMERFEGGWVGWRTVCYMPLRRRTNE